MYEEFIYTEAKLAELRQATRRHPRNDSGLPGAEIPRPGPGVRFEVFRRIAEGR
jgi:hypothetical protein